jgi:hypothetical protein
VPFRGDRFEWRELRGDGLAQSLDARADGAELGLDLLVAAVDVVDAVDDRLAARGETGEDEAGRGA